MATKVEDLVQITPANAQVKIPAKKERTAGAWRVKLVEDFLVAFPSLDRNMINIALDFDDMQAAKFGKDYDAQEHAKEIFPDLSSESEEDYEIEITKDEAGDFHVTKRTKLNDGEGKDRASSPEQQRTHELRQQQPSPVADAS